MNEFQIGFVCGFASILFVLFLVFCIFMWTTKNDKQQELSKSLVDYWEDANRNQERSIEQMERIADSLIRLERK